MPTYKAPVDDFRFLLWELHKIDQYKEWPGFEELDPELTDAILGEGAKFCEEVLQPLNQVGDEHGCTFENGVVRTPPGFKEAYDQYCANGWNRLGASEEMGGAGLPSIITFAFAEMGSSANQAFTMYPGLTNAAYGALAATGAPWMKENIVPKMVSGEWCGTMCLTEPHCGTDLRLMKTNAVEQEDGTYRLNGTKIFISGGDHDMVDNIIHMVIAKIPDENGKLADDLSTVNFFMVPKVNVNEDGTMTDRNGVTCGSIEKKMGIKGSSTCVLNFDDAVAYRLGPKPEKASAEKSAGGKKKSSSAGMKGMFGMMNAARMGVGIQGIAASEVSYQNGVEYANERTAGRALTGAKFPDQSADPIMVHPDIRRMLLLGRSFSEGARALATWVSLMFSQAYFGKTDEEKQFAADTSDLLTPVIKGYFTDMGFEVANASMQCFGGHGYVRDHGMEQFVRDARINQVYEGANGVQALDLVGRKLARNGGRGVMNYFAHIEETLKSAEGNDDLAPLAASLARGYADLGDVTNWLMENALKNPDHAGAASVDYMRIFGIVSLGMMWLKMAKVSTEALAAGTDNPDFYKRKLTCARFWMERVMPDTASAAMRAKAGAETLMELDAAAF